jgi:hypothetical protein
MLFEVAAYVAVAFTVLFWLLKLARPQWQVSVISRIPSTVHAAAQSVLGVVCALQVGLLADGSVGDAGRDLVWGANPWAVFAGEVFFGFIVYDLVHILLIKELFVVEDIVHHTLFCGVAYVVRAAASE